MNENEAAAPESGAPAAQALSNGRFTSVLTARGGGWSRYEGTLLLRWAPDPLSAADASALFVRDVDSGALWSFGTVAGTRVADEEGSSFDGGVLTLRRRDGAIESTLEICVSPYDDVELRRLTLVNGGGSSRRLDVTTYAELFRDSPPVGLRGWTSVPVETELVPRYGALLACRPRAAEEDLLWTAHLLRPLRGAFRSTLEDETTRGRFLGVAGPLAAAAALKPGVSLSGAVGRVRDPVLSLRRGLHLPGGARATVVSVLAAEASREDVEALVRRYALTAAPEEAFPAAAERALNLLADLRIPEGWAQRLPELTGALLLSDAAEPAPEQYELGVPSGAPLVLAMGAEREPLAAAVALGAYWRRQALAVNVLVLASSAAEAESLRDLAERLPAPRGFGETTIHAPGELSAEQQRAAAATARLRLG